KNRHQQFESPAGPAVRLVWAPMESLKTGSVIRQGLGLNLVGPERSEPQRNDIPLETSSSNGSS
ncbi:hypothetical protein JOQ06_001199, partial [Pogonophryne albipinna]